MADPVNSSHVTVDALRKQAFELSRGDQYRLAFFISEHIGFGLVRCTCGGGVDHPADEHHISCPAAIAAPAQEQPSSENATEPLPCPFCGGAAKTSLYGSESLFAIQCQRSPAEMRGFDQS